MRGKFSNKLNENLQVSPADVLRILCGRWQGATARVGVIVKSVRSGTVYEGLSFNSTHLLAAVWHLHISQSHGDPLKDVPD